MARILGPVEFGQLGILQQTVMLIGVTVSFGLGLTGSRFIAEMRSREPDQAGRVLALVVFTALGVSTSLGIGVLATADGVANLLLLNDALAGPLALTVPWLVCCSLSLTMHGCLAGLLAFRSVAWSQFADATVGATLGVAGASVAGLPGALIGLSAGAMAGCCVAGFLLYVHAVDQQIPVGAASFSTAWQEFPALVGFWLPSTMAGLFVALANWLGPVLLVRRPGGFAELALFGVATYWFNALSLLPNMLQRVGTALQASARVDFNESANAEVHRSSIRLNLLIIGAAILPMAVASPLIMSMFGPQYRDGWLTMLVCLATTVCLCFVKPAEQTLNANGCAWLSCRLHGQFALTYILACIPLTGLGAAGLASARLLAFVAHSIGMSLAARSVIAHAGLLSPSVQCEQRRPFAA